MATSIFEIARRYGVGVEYHPEVPETQKLAGSSGMGCDVERRVVLIEERVRGKEDPETLLHEIVHVIVNPPGVGIEVIHEGWILLQFERALARQALTEEEYAAVVDYQTATSIDLYEDDKWICILDDAPEPEKLSFWQEGVARCQLLGLLDEENRVTWQPPDWSCLDALDLPDWLM